MWTSFAMERVRRQKKARWKNSGLNFANCGMCRWRTPIQFTPRSRAWRRMDASSTNGVAFMVVNLVSSSRCGEWLGNVLTNFISRIETEGASEKLRDNLVSPSWGASRFFCFEIATAREDGIFAWKRSVSEIRFELLSRRPVHNRLLLAKLHGTFLFLDSLEH